MFNVNSIFSLNSMFESRKKHFWVCVVFVLKNYVYFYALDYNDMSHIVGS